MRLRLWVGLVALACIGGATFGWAIGELLAWISGDYVVVVSDYVSYGARAGLFAGTLLAACVAGRTPMSNARSAAIRGFIVLGAIAMGVVCIGAAAGALMALVHSPPQWEENLGHPRRHALYLAIHWSWLCAIPLGGVAACGSLWRGWRDPGAVREREPEQEIHRE